MTKFFLILIVIWTANNCAKTEYYLKNVNTKVRLTSYTEDEGYKLKKRFDFSHTRINLFWGLWHVYNKDLDNILKEELTSPEKEAVGNLVLTETYDFLDSFVDFITIGLVRPYSVKVKGDLYTQAFEPKKPKDDVLESSENKKNSKLQNEELLIGNDGRKTDASSQDNKK